MYKKMMLTPQKTIGTWRGALGPGETGYSAEKGYIDFFVFEIPALPDFSSPAFPDLTKLQAIQRNQIIAQRQKQFIAALHNLGDHFGISIRYILRTSETGESVIRLFLIGRVFTTSVKETSFQIERFKKLVISAFPDYYKIVEKSNTVSCDENLGVAFLADCQINSVIEIIKAEECIPAWHSPDICGFLYYYFPLAFLPNDSNDMISLCRALTSNKEETLCIDFLIIPTRSLTSFEQIEITNWTKVCDYFSRDQQIDSKAGLFSQPIRYELSADPRSRTAMNAYEDLLKRYANPGGKYFLYSFRVLSSQSAPADHIASTIASVSLSSESKHHLSIITYDHPSFEKAVNSFRYNYVTASVCNENIWKRESKPSEVMRRLHRMCDLNEVSAFFRLPIPGRDGCPGFSIDARMMTNFSNVKTKESRNVHLGYVIDGSRITRDNASISFDDLTKHSLIVGMSGSGKTTLCFSILKQLWENKIPFIVLEPAKTEYRELRNLSCFSKHLFIFSLGNELVSPYRLNPFEIMKGITVSEHISLLNICFSSIGLWGPLPNIVDQAIREIYRDKGWSEYQIGGENLHLTPPTLMDLYEKAIDIAKNSSYGSDAMGNITGALETRLGSLLRGQKGRCFNTSKSIPFTIIMKRPVILELDSLNDLEKSLITMFILIFIREYSKVNRKSGASLSHVLLLEEAHNIIGRGKNKIVSEDQANYKKVAIDFFINMLAEMRSLGEGIIISDQLPTSIAIEAIKHTNTKIMHKLVSTDDREEIGNSMVFDKAQLHNAPLLVPGYSYVHTEGWPRSKLIKEHNINKEFISRKYSTDTAIKKYMHHFFTHHRIMKVYLPFDTCKDTCRTCQNQIREHYEYKANKLKKIIFNNLQGNNYDVEQNEIISEIISEFFKDEKDPPHESAAISQLEKIKYNCAFKHIIELIITPLVKLNYISRIYINENNSTAEEGIYNDN